jgi:hypothetical protein
MGSKLRLQYLQPIGGLKLRAIGDGGAVDLHLRRIPKSIAIEPRSTAAISKEAQVA